jgi:hypothetical protein
VLCFIGYQQGYDFNELIYGLRSQWPDDLELLLSLDLDNLPCNYAPDNLCQCGIPFRQGVVPSELGSVWSDSWNMHQSRQTEWRDWCNAQIVNDTSGLTGLSQNNQLNRLTQQVHTFTYSQLHK